MRNEPNSVSLRGSKSKDSQCAGGVRKRNSDSRLQMQSVVWVFYEWSDVWVWVCHSHFDNDGTLSEFVIIAFKLILISIRISVRIGCDDRLEKTSFIKTFWQNYISDVMSCVKLYVVNISSITFTQCPTIFKTPFFWAPFIVEVRKYESYSIKKQLSGTTRSPHRVSWLIN